MDRHSLQVIKLALEEDLGKGDVTTGALFPGPKKIAARIVSGQSGVICGLCVVGEVFKILDKGTRVIKRAAAGDRVKKGQVVCVIKGDARAILAGERTALNFLSRLSGVATLTRRYVDAVKPYKVKILDTRKTTPGMRALEKYAVRCGGGVNHRMGLWDQALVKDNHLAVIGLKEIIKRIRERTDKKIEIEAENLKQFREALDAEPEIIMLDNMGIADIKKAVAKRNAYNQFVGARHAVPLLEVSGGVRLDNVRRIAATGVDMISVGALTHSAPAVDFSLEII